MNRRTTVLAIVLTAAVCVGGTWLLKDYLLLKNYGAVVAKTNTVQAVLDRYFLYDYDKDTAADYAALGLTMSLDDPYTTYYDKESFQTYSNGNSGDFVGIGVILTSNDKNELLVTSVVEGGGAEAAGIQVNDIITAIDGTAYKGEQLQEAVSYVKGADEKKSVENTPVKLTIKRDGAYMDLEVNRTRTHTEAVTGRMLDSVIGYIRISKFNSESGTDQRDTSDEFKAQLDALTGQGMRKLVIDLRDNPGGSESAVVKIADMLVPEGLIMYTEDKDGKRTEERSDANELDMPMAVLTNANSASASELLAGALRDHNKAKLVGKTTYGKGIMQTVIPFRDGSGMSVTIAKYFTPNGICVQGEGLHPDFEVDLPEEARNLSISQLEADQDTQLQKAVEILSGEDA